MKEKLQEYALIAEIISAICIVLSLVFVGLQVQQGAEETATNTAAIEASVRESMLATDINILLFAGEHSIMPTELAAGIDSSLTAEQANAAFAALMAEIRSREFQYVQYKAGMLDEATYQSYRNTFMFNLKTNARYAYTWQYVSGIDAFNPEFVAEVTRELASPTSTH